MHIMKRNISSTILIIASLFFTQIKAQQLTIAPAHLVSDYEVPEKLDNQVKSKLQRALTEYGISSEVDASRFSMVPEIIINDEQTTATLPAYCNVNFDFVVSLRDVFSGKNFASTSINVAGSGVNKANAISNGVSGLKFSGNDFSSFCESAKQKIFDYYFGQHDFHH